MNRIVHFEVQGTNQDLLQDFYHDLLGWEFNDMGPEMGNYRIIVTGKDEPGAPSTGINGGLTRRTGDIPEAGTPVNGFVCIVDVADTDATLEKAVRLGGKIASPAMEVFGVGRLGYVLDPENNLFGVLAPVQGSMPTP